MRQSESVPKAGSDTEPPTGPHRTNDLNDDTPPAKDRSKSEPSSRPEPCPQNATDILLPMK